MAKKEATDKTLLEQAKKIADAHNTKTVYANSKGEFFTNKNYALNSDKTDNIKTFSFENEVETEQITEDNE